MPTTETLTDHIIATPATEKLWGLLTPADGLCQLCRGSGHLMCFQDGRREFWDCPACGGAGARALFAQPAYRVQAMKGAR